jgi:hypothetical protein
MRERSIRDAQDIRRPNVMPDLGVAEEDGREMAAYSYILQ